MSSDFKHHVQCSGVHQGAFCYRLDDVRGAIVGMTSAMLDNPDKDGIYPTSRFYDKMDEYIKNVINDSYKVGYKDAIEEAKGPIAAANL